MKDGKLSQKEIILRHLRDFGTITTYEAMRDYGIVDFRKRVSELRQAGYPILSRTVETKNRYGAPVSFNEYYMEVRNV